MERWVVELLAKKGRCWEARIVNRALGSSLFDLEGEERGGFEL